MSIALELGTREFRSLRREGHRLIGRSCPCVYVVLPEGPAERKLLDQAKIGYSACNGSLLVMGSPAIELARSLRLPCLSPFEANRLPPGDTVARQIAATMIDAVIPARIPAQYRCVLTVPGSYRNDGSDKNGRENMPGVSTAATLVQFIRLKGYDSSVLSNSYAVGLAELGNDRLTGIALHFGTGECQASLLQQGRELLHIGIPRGEDSLLDEWARRRDRLVWDYEGHCYLHQMAVREWRDRTQPSLISPSDDDAQIWKELVAALAAELLVEFIPQLARVPGLSKTRLPVVFAGGMTVTAGFALLLGEAFAAHSDRISPAAIRPASDANYSATRGMLIFAEGLAEDAREIARPLGRVG